MTTPKTVTEEVIEERAKQVRLGFTAEHDDEHTGGQLRDAAAFMLYPSTHDWPFTDGEPNVGGMAYRGRMIIAAAFCIAEAERSDRETIRAALQQIQSNYGAAYQAILNLNGEALMNIDKVVKARLKELEKQDRKAAKKKGKKK
jgi:hypothetical protein